MNNLICWHNGEYKPLLSVSISPLDFGFIHSDATYDVLRIKNKKIMFRDLHLSRFFKSCEYFYFSPVDNIQLIAETLIEKNNIENAFLWLTSWRGIPPSGSPRDINAPQHNLIYVKPYYGISVDGLNMCIDRENRRTPDAVHNQEYKNFAWIEFNRAQRNAVANNYDSALLLTVDDYISEGPGFGVCFVKDNVVLTPSKDCLKSITVDVVEELCSKMNIVFKRCNITEEAALSADEAFICSTSGGITPIKKLNDRIYSHNLTERLRAKYDNLV
jgi:branched-chain amino acid aminotransferase